MYLTKKDISQLERLQKINLVNSLSGYKSANLIGSVSKDNKENVAIFSSVVHLGSNPPILGFILRPTTIPRNTFKNIKETGYYTINHVQEDFIKDAHHTSAKYPENVSEFDMTSLTPTYKNNFIAPFVLESPIQIAMKYVDEYHIKVNDVVMVVGEIQAVYIEDKLIEKDFFINLSKGKIATINGLDGYAIPELDTRFGYQKPK